MKLGSKYGFISHYLKEDYDLKSENEFKLKFKANAGFGSINIEG